MGVFEEARNTLLSCVTSWEKSKEISQDIRKRHVDLHKSGSSLSIISDTQRCHVHLFNQLYACINSMGMSIHHTIEEVDGPCPRD